jgi:hypothetical protein
VQIMGLRLIGLADRANHAVQIDGDRRDLPAHAVGFQDQRHLLRTTNGKGGTENASSPRKRLLHRFG